MTEIPIHHEKPMCVRVWLEVGHACEPRRSALGRALALDWRVWVKGVSGQDISPFVHKVVFHLHPASAFVYPKRVIQAPPYEIQESGCASIEIPIHVYLKHSEPARRIRLRYSLCAESASRSCSESRTVFYDVENPSEPLWRELVRAGAEVVARTDTRARQDSRLVVLLADQRRARAMKPAKGKPTRPKKGSVGSEACGVCGAVGRCGEAVGAALRQQLVAARLPADEAASVWRLCCAVARHARAPDALLLPAFSDPIYRLPELPGALRAALSSVEADLAMQ